MGQLKSGLALAVIIVSAVLVGCSDGGGQVGPVAPTTTTDDGATTVPSTRPVTTLAPVTPVPTTETPVRRVEPPARSVWIHLFDATLKTESGIVTMLDEVAAADVDAVFVQVARRHDAYYDSAYLPRTPDPDLEPGLDVLATLIAEARPRGIQVHAWFVIAPAIHREYDDLVLPSGHVWLDHGPGAADSWMTVAADGTISPDYFDVGLPEVRDHAVAIVSDIASRYEVDGIHLDYVRYDGERWGYHPRALARYGAETGRSGRPSPSDPAWVAWRQEQPAALVAAAKSALDSVRPNALLSAAVIAAGPGPSELASGFAGSRAATTMFQNWPAWVEDGTIDLIILMAYTREQVAEHAGWFRQWVAFAGTLSADHPGRVAVGVGAYLNSASDVMTQIRLAEAATGHVAVYSYQQDSADAARGAVLAHWSRP